MRHDRRRHHESHEVDSYARESRRIAWLEANGFTHRRSFFDLQRGMDRRSRPRSGPAGSRSRATGPARKTRPSTRWSMSTPHGPRCPGTRSGRWRRGGRRSRPSTAAGSRAATGAPSAGSSAACSATGADGSSSSPSPAPRAVSVSAARAAALARRALPRGATSLALGVQGENENAIGLYRDVGFEVEREWRVYSRPAD